MHVSHSAKTVLPIWLKLLLIVALLTPQFSSPFLSSRALAQSIPPACVDDAGNAHTPTVVGGWALLLNFNHARSATDTRGCLVTRMGPGANQVSYALVVCALINNGSGATVGGGRADFNGQFWIECPSLPPVPTNPPAGPLYDNFYVYGRAAFPFTNSTQTLMAHPDADVTAKVDASWHVELTSRYGATTFVNLDGTTNIAGTFPRLYSQVLAKVGAHYVNGQQLQPTATVPPFPFDASKKIRVGNQGETWSLFELIIDPGPRPQCCFNP